MTPTCVRPTTRARRWRANWPLLACRELRLAAARRCSGATTGWKMRSTGRSRTPEAPDASTACIRARADHRTSLPPAARCTGKCSAPRSGGNADLHRRGDLLGLVQRGAGEGGLVITPGRRARRQSSSASAGRSSSSRSTASARSASDAARPRFAAAQHQLCLRRRLRLQAAVRRRAMIRERLVEGLLRGRALVRDPTSRPGAQHVGPDARLLPTDGSARGRRAATSTQSRFGPGRALNSPAAAA